MLAVCSLIKNRSWILPHFLECLRRTTYPRANTILLLLDDVSTDGSLEIIGEFGRQHLRDYAAVRVIAGEGGYDNNTSSRDFHGDRHGGYRHLAALRNILLDNARALDVDLLFSVDSDILFPSDIVNALARWQLPYVSSLVLNDNSAPFVKEHGSDYQHLRGRRVNFAPCDEHLQFQHRTDYPLNSLLQVGMSGACYLLDKRALESGARFGYHPFGEDAWYCLELRERGIPVYVDTTPRCVHVMERDQLDAALARVEELTRCI